MADDKTVRELINEVDSSGANSPNNADIIGINVDNATALGLSKRMSIANFKDWILDFVPTSVQTFLGLSDVSPSSYNGAAGKVVTVNGGETGLSFTALPSFDLDVKYNVDEQALLNSSLTVDQNTHISKTTASPYILTSSLTYIIDRWKVANGGGGSNATVEIIETTMTAGETGNAFRIRSLGTNGQAIIRQDIDSTISTRFANQTITVSAWVSSGFADSTYITIGGVSSAKNTGIGFELLSVTVDGSTLPNFNFSVVNDMTSAVQITEVIGMNVNVGSTRIPPVQRHNELQLCQRYAWYIHSTGKAVISTGGATTSTSGAVGDLIFPTTMRVIPTLVTTGVPADYQVRHNGGDVTSTSIPTIFLPTTANTGILFNCASVFTLSDALQLRLATGSGKYIGFDAEI